MPRSLDADHAADHARRLRRITVVGAGLAGLRTAASLRENGFRGEVTILGAEGLAPYDRPPLSKELFTRTEPAWLASEFGLDVFALADRVELASPGRWLAPGDGPDGGVRIGLADGAELASDVAIIATGSRPWLPPDFAGATVLRTAADAAALRSRLSAGSRLVVIGAGWLGAEVAGAAAAEGCQVTVLEAASAPLARELGTEIGTHTTAWYAAGGVDLHLGARVTTVRADGVGLVDGRWFGADVVLAAIGARPSTAWLESSLALTARGAIGVDRVGCLQVPAAGFAPGSVRAVGDCADRTTERDGRVRGAHWEGALHNPGLLAIDILGGPLPEADPAPYTFSSQFGHALALFGRVRPRQRSILRGDPRAGGWAALFVEPREGLRPTEAVLTAGLAVDAPRDVGALRRLLRRVSLPVIDLEVAADPSRSLREALRG